MSSIYSCCKACLDYYNLLQNTLDAISVAAACDLGFDKDNCSEAIGDAAVRFKAWATNIGALQQSYLQSSLDARLVEATDIRQRIIKILSDLGVSLHTATRIMAGEEPNETWQVGEISDSEDEEGNIKEGGTKTSELDELLSAAETANGSLMKLSVVIRTSPQRDDYLKAASRVNIDARWDIAHVREKHGAAKRKQDWLLKRLGKAITRRRQYLSYRQDHHWKLSQNWEDGLKDKTNIDEAQTIAHTKATTYVERQAIPGQDGSDFGGSFGSQTSYDPTVAGEADTLTKLTVPLPPKEFDGVPFHYGDPFRCPYCYTEQIVKNKTEWKKHVFRDLKPYVCTFRECDLNMFKSRNEWFAHELQHHRREWVCTSCAKSFRSKSSFKSHLVSAHALSGTHLEAMIFQSEEPVDRLPVSACMLCDDLELSFTGRHQDAKRAFLNDGVVSDVYVTLGQFRRHLGRHMEQLALFALPRHNDDGMDDESEAETDSRNNEAPDSRGDSVSSVKEALLQSFPTPVNATTDGIAEDSTRLGPAGDDPTSEVYVPHPNPPERLAEKPPSPARSMMAPMAQDFRNTEFNVLAARRRELHEQNIQRITERAAYYYKAKPHPSEIASAEAELERGLEEDFWATRGSVSRGVLSEVAEMPEQVTKNKEMEVESSQAIHGAQQTRAKQEVTGLSKKDQMIADHKKQHGPSAREQPSVQAVERILQRCREPGCEEEFDLPSDLTRHEKTHSRPWKCPNLSCMYHEYGWPTELEMDRHVDVEHSEVTALFQCEFPPCPYKFKRQSQCKQHMEKAHGWEYVRSNDRENDGDEAAPVTTTEAEMDADLEAVIPLFPPPPPSSSYMRFSELSKKDKEGRPLFSSEAVTGHDETETETEEDPLNDRHIRAAPLSSYWSFPEQKAFIPLLGHFGTDWHAIANHMKSKTHFMVKNYYERQVASGKEIWKELAMQTDEKRARGNAVGPLPVISRDEAGNIKYVLAKR